MEEVELKEKATDNQIADYKKKYGEVFTVKANGHIAYFRKPNREEVSETLSLYNVDSLAAMENLLKTCYISGSKVFLDELSYMRGCYVLVDKLLEVVTVELGNV
jgi:hypothetical protein